MPDVCRQDPITCIGATWVISNEARIEKEAGTAMTG